jgi:tetratricopeptide (TPR) repeat protein
VHWARTLDGESENLRATLTHCAQTPQRSEDVLRVFIALEWYFVSRSSWDLLPILAKAMKSVGDAPTKLFAGALIIQGQLEIAFGMLDDDLVARAAAQAERGLAIARDLGEDALESRALGILAYYAGRRHDIDVAVALAQESIDAARRSGQSFEISIALFSAIGGRIGDVLFTPEETLKVIDEVRAIWTSRGFSSGLAAIGSRAAGEALGRGDIELAVREWRDAMNLLDENGAAWWARSPRVNLAIGLGALGHFDEAAPLLRRSLREARRAGFRTDVGPLVEMAGSLAESMGDAIRGAQLFGAGQSLNQHGLDIGTLSPNTPFEDEFEHGLEARLRADLGDEAYEREYAYGATLTVHAATDLALGQTPRRGEPSERIGPS